MKMSGGNTIIRVKPVGAGGGGVESSAKDMKDNEAGLRYLPTGESVGPGGGGRIDIVEGNFMGKSFDYMDSVVPPEIDNEQLYSTFLPSRVEAFMSGYNVNLLAYGQTGTATTGCLFIRIMVFFRARPLISFYSTSNFLRLQKMKLTF